MEPRFVTLEQPLGEGGVEAVNFFNGRLLTAADMRREQSARRAADARIGEALGDGVAFGLEVTARAPDAEDPVVSLEISPGVAVNRAGSVLRLAVPERVHLSRTDSTSFATGAPCPFDDCVPLKGGTYVAGEGLYLLTVAPAEIALGRAPSNGLGGTEARCDVDRKVEAVQFRLLEIPTALYPGLTPTAPAFRNEIAYRCFGPGVETAWATTLLAGGRRGDPLLESMAGYGLTPLDVPLAVVGFQGSAELTLLDSWAARRPLSIPDPAGALHSLAAPRRAAVGRAMFEQFQAHFADLLATGAPGTFKARTHFPHLPPVGILPRTSETEAKAFFGGMTIRGPIHINSAALEPLVRESLTAPALRSASTDVVWLYAVAENLIAGANAAADAKKPDPYLVYASANLAYRGDARFNLHRWNYANFALGGG